MRVALGVYVAHRAVDARGGDLQDLDVPGDLDAATAAADDVGVVRGFDGDVRPGVEAQAVLDHRVGAPELEHHAGPHLGFVEVLGAARKAVDLHEVTANRLSE